MMPLGNLVNTTAASNFRNEYSVKRLVSIGTKGPLTSLIMDGIGLLVLVFGPRCTHQARLEAAGARVAVNYSSDREGAIETLTRGLALELAPRKIRVNAIAPGHTETEGNATAGTFEGGAGAVLAGKTPLGRLGRVTDIAPLAVFLASDESAWITGEVIRAAGGLVVAT